LADDRVKSGGYRRAAHRPHFVVDEIGSVGVAPLDELELSGDRGLVADEHESAAVARRDFARLHFGTEGYAGAADAVGLRFRLPAERIVARIDLADMRRIGTAALEGVVAVIEIIVAPGVARR
jgi:hypothetical protein